MSVTSISDISRQHMLNILGYNSASQSTQPGTNSLSPAGAGTGSTQLSPFAQMLAELQQLEQSNPTKYAQVSQQISSNLSTAASNAQSAGKSSLASQLTMLSKDFSTASQTGQLPSVSDLAQVMSSGNSANTGTAAAISGTSSGTPHHGVLKSMENILQTIGI